MVRSCRTEQSNSETESGREKASSCKKEAGPSDLPSGKGTMSLRSLSPRIWGSRADGPERENSGRLSARGGRAASPSRLSMLLGRRSPKAKDGGKQVKDPDTPDLTQRSEETVSSESAQLSPQQSPVEPPPPPPPPLPRAPHRGSTYKDDDTELNLRELVREQPDKEFGAMTSRTRAVIEEARQLGCDVRDLLLEDGASSSSSGGSAIPSSASAGMLAPDEGIAHAHGSRARSKNVMVQVAERARERARMALAVAEAREAEDAALQQLREVRDEAVAAEAAKNKAAEGAKAARASHYQAAEAAFKASLVLDLANETKVRDGSEADRMQIALAHAERIEAARKAATYAAELEAAAVEAESAAASAAKVALDSAAKVEGDLGRPRLSRQSRARLSTCGGDQGGSRDC